MERNSKGWSLCGFLFVSAMGTALHFLYEWSGGNTFAALVSGVNESVWEHMKLLFVPLLLWTLLFGKGNFAAGAVSTLAGLLLIPTVYYTYTGALGFRSAFVDIALFYVAAAVVFLLQWRLLRAGRLSKPWQQWLGLAVLAALAAAFVWCTFRPPRLPLWQDPVTKLYGVAPQ